jgi:hypothetical protein
MVARTGRLVSNSDPKASKTGSSCMETAVAGPLQGPPMLDANDAATCRRPYIPPDSRLTRR